MLILWSDEAQRFVTASATDGMSDYNLRHITASAGDSRRRCTTSTSFIPALGREKARVFTLNLCNRLIFQSRRRKKAPSKAPLPLQEARVKKSWSYLDGRCRETILSRRSTDKPHIRRSLAKQYTHRCTLRKDHRGNRGKVLPPIESDGNVHNGSAATHRSYFT